MDQSKLLSLSRGRLDVQLSPRIVRALLRRVLPALAWAALTACVGKAAPVPETVPPATAGPESTEATAEATGDVPYRLLLRAFTIDGLPGLHSSVVAGSADRLVLAAGRTNGLHGFAPDRAAAQAPSFPKAQANDTLYVVDLVGRRLLGQAEVASLPPPYVNQLTASNTQYSADGDFLYVVGGYGPDVRTGVMVTLPYLTVVDLDALADTVISGGLLDAGFAAAHMASHQHEALAVTGGDLMTLGGDFLLVYGQRFDGEYTPGGGQVFQEYSNSVRLFGVAAARTDGGVELAVEFKGSVPDEPLGLEPDNPFHRRDLTVRWTRDPASAPRLGVYGGVFKGGRLESFVHPIYITSGTDLGIAVGEDTAAAQLLSQYDCGVVQVHSASRGASWTTFYGGISQYYWDPSCRCLRRDAVDLNTRGIDGLPFIDSVSTLRVDASGSTGFLHRGQRFPPASGAPRCFSGDRRKKARFLGAETKFVAAPGAPVWADGVVDLDAVEERVVIGYLLGGIAASCPRGGDDNLRCYASTQGSTCASDVIYEVTLDPRAATPTEELTLP